MSVFVARQPILDEKLRTVAYEFLFRSGTENLFVADDNDTASLTTMSNLLDDDDLDRLSSGKTVFINFTPELLRHDFASLLPKSRVVIEIVEEAWCDHKLIPSCARLKEAGFKLALDDVYDLEVCKQFKEIAEIVKVDFLLTDRQSRKQISDFAISHGMVPLAEKVETHKSWQEALQMDYTLFQGYYFSKPRMVASKSSQFRKSTDVLLLKEVVRPDFDLKRVEKIVKHSPVLSLKLLKYINSAAFNLGSPIRSIRHALIMLGEKTLRKLMLVWIYAGFGKNNPTLLNQAAVRGMFCEQLAPVFQENENAGEIFMMGLFSLIDAILDQPLLSILDTIDVSPEVESALLGRGGPYAAILDLVKGYERGNWESVSSIVDARQISERDLPTCYMEAAIWAQTIAEDVPAPAAVLGGK